MPPVTVRRRTALAGVGVAAVAALVAVHPVAAQPPTPRAVRRVVQTVAGAIGATPQDVHAQLKAGRSLAEIGAARGKSQADLKDALLDPARQRLATAVAQGRVTRAWADALLDRAGARLDARLTRKRAGGG